MMSGTGSNVTVFVDEAGDLGFSNRSGKYFVIVFVYTEDAQRIRVLIRRNLRELRLHGFEFKFSRDMSQVRSFFLNEIGVLDFDAGVVACRKQDIKIEMRQDTFKLYNFLVLNYLVRDLASFNYRTAEFVFDRKYSPASITRFNEYAKWKLREVFQSKGRLPPTATFRHAISGRDEGIQIADYIAGAVFQKFERGDDQWYKLIAGKIRYKQPFGNVVF